MAASDGSALHPEPPPPEVLAGLLRRFARVRGRVDKARRAIADDRPVPGETEARLNLYAEREEMRRFQDDPGLAARATLDLVDPRERIIGADDILHIGFLARGMRAARAVGRVEVMGGLERGTGFLVAPDALMTNNHVLANPTRAARAAVEFEIHDANGVLAEIRRREFDPGRFWFTHAELDVTIVALAEPAGPREATDDLGWHPMISQQGKIRIGDPVNIIQHPGTRTKSLVVHNSSLLHLENRSALSPFLWYSSDTEKGSSGAPVFNRHWEVVGVHHRGVPKADRDGNLLDINGEPLSLDAFRRDPSRAHWVANEGTRTSQIVKALAAAAFDKPAHTQFRDDLAAAWESSQIRNRGQAAARADDPAVAESQAGPGATTTLRGAGGVTLHITITPGS